MLKATQVLPGDRAQGLNLDLTHLPKHFASWSFPSSHIFLQPDDQQCQDHLHIMISPAGWQMGRLEGSQKGRALIPTPQKSGNVLALVKQ